MNRLALIILGLSLIAVSAKAATITGTVSNTVTAPVANQKVYAYDSLINHTDSAITNATGVYAITLSAAVTSGHPLRVFTTSCGIQKTNYYTYTGANITNSNFLICGGSFTLYGTVSLGGIANNGLARLYLIQQLIDTTVSPYDTTLTAIDSFTTAGIGGTFSNTYSAMPGGRLLLKAALLSSHPAYASYLPTYYTSSLVWSNAASLSSANFASTATNINMVAGSNPGGSGFVSGSVLLGANKAAAIGDPLPGRILILTTGANVAVKHVYSDAAGKFTISGLTAGTYKIFGDALGKLNPALTFTLTATKPNITGIIFEENTRKFEGHFATTTGINSATLSGVGVFPNPVGNQLSISGLNGVGGDKTVVLRDMKGSVLLTQHFANGQLVEVGTAGLPAGIYLLQLRTEAGAASFRVAKQ